MKKTAIFRFLNSLKAFPQLALFLIATALPAQTVSTINTDSQPYGIAVTSGGNVYVGYLSATLRKMNANGGALTTLVSSIVLPSGVALDSNENVYLVDRFNKSVVRAESNGTVTTIKTGFTDPYKLARDQNGNFYVTDAQALKKIEPNGVVTTLSSGHNFLIGVAADSNGKIYFADNTSMGELIKIDADGSNKTVIASGLFYPFGITVGANGKLYVCESGNKQIKSIDLTSGNVVTIISEAEVANDVATDGNGNLFVTYTTDNKVKKITLPNLEVLEGKKSTLSISPNPAKDFVLLNSIKKGVAVSLMDFTGKVLHTELASGTTHRLNVSSFPNGIYLLKAGEQITKLIISK